MLAKNHTPIWNYIKQDWLFDEVKPRGRGYALTNTERERRERVPHPVVLKIISRDIRFGEGGVVPGPKMRKRGLNLSRLFLLHRWGQRRDELHQGTQPPLV